LAAPLELILAADPPQVVIQGPGSFYGGQLGSSAAVTKIRFAEQTAEQLALPKAMGGGTSSKRPSRRQELVEAIWPSWGSSRRPRPDC
jgi:hypothetical protein